MILGRNGYINLARPFRSFRNQPINLSRRTFTPSASFNMSRIDMRSTNYPNEEPHAFPSPESWPAAKVRDTFMKYFTEAKPGLEHTFWPSSNVIPFEDPTLLFANAVSELWTLSIRSPR